MTRRDIVVIGASAGGVRALRVLAAALPADFAAAVCVVLHVGPYESTLPALLEAVGPLPAAHAQSGQRLKPGRILIAPPDHHLLLEDGAVRLTRGPKEHHTRPAVDPLFRSAALSQGPRVIGVLLTGGLDDGSAGLQAIKQCGGLVVVQDPADAEDPGMPSAALQAVEVDHCVPLERVGALLVELVQEAAPAAAAALPVSLVHEHLAGVGGENAMDELRQVGVPSTLVCPDCKGTLWEISGARPPRYRCHTGHAFSLRSLAAVQQEATENALWSAVRALQEKELLLRKVAALERSAGDEARAAQVEAEAGQLREQAEMLRGLVEQG
ncbi:chemotaxis protein CheB [Azohydromonas caseinilytica]|uniref:protein-glutamate methylesterase n=1 Tax=Azohydromonas caseinilytica TaxID=2728836 RepID=A0A848FA01_9BURK|nr:chemotaxis protein CheB [Azohydromonas caseinilytica]NML16078.1 chemotaxis protein CheB [Azohydromonas caseinilytica]